LKVKAYLGLGLTNAFRGQRDTARQYLQTCVQLPLNGQAQMDYAAESQQIAQSILK
jgi:ATP/maltotriose-dependent transcriptional regulator MalT